MDRTFWQRQTSEQPLFSDLLWSRPETKRTAGKLLIVGGSVHGFSAPAETFGEASKAGIGTTRVLLPDSLQKTVSKMFPAGEYAPSTPSGSFARQALAELLDRSHWADGVLLAGDFGRNSETAIMLEEFLSKLDGPLTLVQDSIDYFQAQTELIASREQTTIVPTFSQLQKLANGLHFPKAFTSTMDFLHLVDALHELTLQYPLAIVLNHLDTTFVSVGGQVSTTKPASRPEMSLAAHAAVWGLQNPSKPFEALTSSLL
jgi:NAD(P)H-hydrate repair Nnr-like enzyme with NAD(P)H-hydrate dehydratase domain